MVRPKIFLSLALLLALVPLRVSGAPRNIVAKPCPFSCALAGLTRATCRDWRRGNTCYVQNLSNVSAPERETFILCVKAGTSSVQLKKRCRADQGESELTTTALKGERGDAGAQGPVGPVGADGALRMYGDGSYGNREFIASGTLSDSNPQYVDFTINAGVTVQVHSGTVVRCTGSFRNDGTIQVLPALRDQPRFGENGQRLASPNSGGLEAPGGSGGSGLATGVAQGLLRLGLMGGGNGYREQSASGAAGGGNVTVLCQGTITNNGTISADGSAAQVASQGGGGGGYIVLASATLVTNNGSIFARGAAGGSLLATDPNSTGHGPGGGGGGGIVHFVAPQIGATGSVNVGGGAGGAAGAAGAITGLVYLGGGSGGGAGGKGGDGGTVNPGNSADDSTTAGEGGSTGQFIQTATDPAVLF